MFRSEKETSEILGVKTFDFSFYLKSNRFLERERSKKIDFQEVRTSAKINVLSGFFLAQPLPEF